MRVCFISHTAGRYGAELALLELLQGLTQLNVTCLVLVPAKGPLLTELDRLDIEWRVISYPPWISRRSSLVHRMGRTFKALASSFQMALIITRWRCDIVYTNTTVIGAGALAARLARKPHVWHSHESGYHNPNLKFDFGHRLVAFLMNSLSGGIIVNSTSVKNDYKRYIRPDKMRLIYQSVTVHDKCPQSEPNSGNPPFRCAIIGSLHAWKGQDEAIKALSEVVRRGVNAHLLVVGDGDKRFTAALHEQVKNYGLEQRVTFLGYVTDPIRFTQIADVILVCSKWEAFGRVTVEAMLAGKPVVATANSGGTAELIEEGKTGLLYERGNHIELADKIQYLYENPDARIRLGTAAQMWTAGRFTRERYAREVLSLLGEVWTKEKTSLQSPSN
ncbi:glycosyltransferase family 4 protein [Nitrosospira sp. Is2]|uniref:glycosyltransferase family 4 protein n=1 Tax=Nitrosospira sp. Is2 TaxID=3080532 RepID=UPI002954968B|nr:glycosyltransferase family 4 protein [Nitrosospira sp. Is2]WON73730.1 glycosyltransferase family 4 protein [Nitrosospira sp. Is2]